MKIAVSCLNSRDIPTDLRKISVTDVDYIHVDVMDGKFVKNKTISFSEMKEIHRYTHKRLDVHLMVKNPIKFIHDDATLNTEYITVHLETKNVYKALELIEEYGIKKGISIKPNTPLDGLEPYLDCVDLILVMSVEPGKGGQEFIPSTIERIKELRKKLKKHNSKAIISVDGGINDKTGAQCIKAGADILVAGSYIYNNDAYDAIQSLKG